MIIHNIFVILNFPFILIDKNNESIFRVGYIIQYYSKSFHDIFKNLFDSFSLPSADITYTLPMLATILSNLHDLEQYGIIVLHRDLSPNNIMIDINNKIKLIDFLDLHIQG